MTRVRRSGVDADDPRLEDRPDLDAARKALEERGSVRLEKLKAELRL